MDTDFFSTIRDFKFTSRKHRISDESAVDRINSFYSPLIIIMISSVIGAKMYLVGDPMQCWIPPEFHASWEQFAENYCWVKNTYFVPPNAQIPGDKIDREQEELNYYQWVPFMLALQALMFYLPSAIWKLLNWQSGVHITDLVETALNCLEADPEVRENSVALLTRHIEQSIMKQQSMKKGIVVRIKRLLFRVLLCGYTKTGNYLTMTYMFVKLLFVINVVGQFFLLNRFLGTDYNFYGIEVLRDLMNNRNWRQSGHFPRVTLCDFDIRVLGNMHPRTLQCVLVVNLFNEKAYIFLWFFLVAVAAVTILDALAWLLWSLVPRRRNASIRKYLKSNSKQESRLQDEFLLDYIRSDGAFVLRIISKNAGDPVVHGVVQRLWKKFLEDNPHKLPERASAGDDEFDALIPGDTNGTFV